LSKLGLGEVLWREVREKGNGVLASLPQVVGVAVEKLSVLERLHRGALDVFVSDSHVSNGLLCNFGAGHACALELAQTESELREVDCCVGDTDPGNHAMGVLISAMLLLNGQWT
jgi:hypothetical protein